MVAVRQLTVLCTAAFGPRRKISRSPSPELSSRSFFLFAHAGDKLFVPTVNHHGLGFSRLRGHPEGPENCQPNATVESEIVAEVPLAVYVFITAVPIIKLFAWGEGDSGGHVL